jgi:hypothetical protein
MIIPDVVITTTLLCLDAKHVPRDAQEIILKFANKNATVPFHKKSLHSELVRHQAKLDISTRVDARPSPYSRLPPVLFIDEYELFLRHFERRMTNASDGVPVRLYVCDERNRTRMVVHRMSSYSALEALRKIQ